MTRESAGTVSVDVDEWMCGMQEHLAASIRCWVRNANQPFGPEQGSSVKGWEAYLPECRLLSALIREPLMINSKQIAFLMPSIHKSCQPTTDKPRQTVGPLPSVGNRFLEVRSRLAQDAQTVEIRHLPPMNPEGRPTTRVLNPKST